MLVFVENSKIIQKSKNRLIIIYQAKIPTSSKICRKGIPPSSKQSSKNKKKKFTARLEDKSTFFIVKKRWHRISNLSGCSLSGWCHAGVKLCVLDVMGAPHTPFGGSKWDRAWEQEAGRHSVATVLWCGSYVISTPKWEFGFWKCYECLEAEMIMLSGKGCFLGGKNCF